MRPSGLARFDGWVSARTSLVAAREPLRRWRPHPSTPLMRRRASLASESANKRMTNLARPETPIPTIRTRRTRGGGEALDRVSHFIKGSPKHARFPPPRPRSRPPARDVDRASRGFERWRGAGQPGKGQSAPGELGGGVGDVQGPPSRTGCALPGSAIAGNPARLTEQPARGREVPQVPDDAVQRTKDSRTMDDGVGGDSNSRPARIHAEDGNVADSSFEDLRPAPSRPAKETRAWERTGARWRRPSAAPRRSGRSASPSRARMGSDGRTTATAGSRRRAS